MKIKVRCVALLALCAGLLAGADTTKRFQLTLDRVLKGGPPPYSEKLILADVQPEAIRRFTEYSGDVSGRYVGAVAEAAAFTGHPAPSLDRLVRAILGFQKPGGYFGAAFRPEIGHEEMALLWGNGRLLIGLLEYYQRHPSAQVLHAARQIGDFLVGIAPQLNNDELQKRVDAGDFAAAYICWTQQIEGLVELSRVTRDPQYLKLAKVIAARLHRGPAQHGHGFLTSVRGLVRLYDATHDARYLEQAAQEWRGVIDSGNLLPQGTVPEAFAPKIRRTEGCTEADWLRLSLALWRDTHKLEYLEQAELTLFNEFAMNQFSTGDYGSRVISATGISDGAGPEGEGTARAWWCCTLHGLRAFPDIFAAAFHADGADLIYDLAIDGHGETNGLAVEADASLEADASVRMKATRSDSRPHVLRVRVPEWASAVSVSGAHASNGSVEVRRAWKVGEVVSIRYTLRTRAVKAPGSDRIVLFHGPWILGVDSELSPFFFDEPSAPNRLKLTIHSDGTVPLKPAAAASVTPFAIPSSRFKVTYLPGGYPMVPSEAVLRPIAEQTGTRSLAWDFLFLTEQ